MSDNEFQDSQLGWFGGVEEDDNPPNKRQRTNHQRQEHLNDDEYNTTRQLREDQDLEYALMLSQEEFKQKQESVPPVPIAQSAIVRSRPELMTSTEGRRFRFLIPSGKKFDLQLNCQEVVSNVIQWLQFEHNHQLFGVMSFRGNNLDTSQTFENFTNQSAFFVS